VTVDEATGMVTLRVIVPNPDQLLLPGMFMRHPAGGRAPARPAGAADCRDPYPKGGATVMVVTADNKVELREVQVGRMSGDSWVVESGLKAGEKVIVAGLQKVKPGVVVAPTERRQQRTTDPGNQAVGWSSRLMARFFIDRPIFAWVIALVIMLAGAMAIIGLPVAQYPTIAPPAVGISASYPGPPPRRWKTR
jgi:hypothetical protein